MTSDSPLITEAVAFRWLVIVLVAAAVVIAAALVIDPAVGAAILAAELAAGAWLAVRAVRGRRSNQQ